MLSQITARHNSAGVIVPSYFLSIFRELIVAVPQSRSSRRAIRQAVSVLNLSFDRTDTATRRGEQGVRVPFRKGKKQRESYGKKEREIDSRKKAKRKENNKNGQLQLGHGRLTLDNRPWLYFESLITRDSQIALFPYFLLSSFSRPLSYVLLPIA